MRHLLLALMIALLPVRGWIGDAMATGMAVAQAQQTATKSIASHAHEPGAQAHIDHETIVAEAQQASPDCAGHAPGDQSHMAQSHCDSCTVCQACHTVALSPLTAATATVLNSLAPPHSAAGQLASADVALDQKPPIS